MNRFAFKPTWIYSFWSRNPALFFGFSILLGTALSFKHDLKIGLLFIGFCLMAKSFRTMAFAIACFAIAFASTACRYPNILLPNEKIQGKGIFHIDQVKPYSSPFHRCILYKGVLRNFQDVKGNVFKELPCNIYLPLFGKRQPADTDYEIQGTLCQKGDFAFVLKPEKKSSWVPLSSSANLAEWRYRAKQALSFYLKKEIVDDRARTFLNALATGDVDERILSMEFGKIGLQHILAISGFHFAFVALFSSFLLRLFLPDKISSALLIAVLSFYYLFLGNAPSIQRAYVAICLVLIGQLFSLRISGLNALGVGLIVELLFNPLCVTYLSFQLTFLCALAILLFYPVMHLLIAQLLPKRFYSEALSMSLLEKHGFLLSALLRKALALNLAVHLISFPLLLHLFHKFPLLSIAYNLFFPACVCVSMLLLFFALLFLPLLPFLSHIFKMFNNAWTSLLLNLTTQPPAYLDFCIRSREVSFSFVMSFLAISFFLGIFFYEKEQSRVNLGIT
jgi:competence protein ComEC